LSRFILAGQRSFTGLGRVYKVFNLSDDYFPEKPVSFVFGAGANHFNAWPDIPAFFLQITPNKL